MTYRFLEIFMAVVECGKMSEAAKKLYITQSSVSQAIAAIEKEYGILLFERLSHGLYLTEDGRELMAYAKKIMATKSDMEEFLSNSKYSRRLRVGATVTVGTCVISPILKSVRRGLPNVDMSVFVSNTREIEERLLNNELDIGLVEGIVHSPELVHQDVIRDSMVLICPPGHRFWGAAKVDAAELCSEPLVLREKDSGTRASFEEQMSRLGYPVRVRWECSNSEAIKNAVKDGHGLSIISRRLVLEDLESGALFASDVAGLNLHRYFAVVYHKNKHITESIRCFIDECRAFSHKEHSEP